MREIKFRAWDKDANKMYVVGRLEWLHEEISEVQRDKSRGWTNDTISNYIIMQYIGLKDKNGKEIYEGDIVDIDCSKEYQRDVKGIIKFSYGSFNVVDEKEIHYSFGEIPDEIFIIGNIHENQEVIK